MMSWTTTCCNEPNGAWEDLLRKRFWTRRYRGGALKAIAGRGMRAERCLAGSKVETDQFCSADFPNLH